jgi:hypothetical protein
MFMDDELVRMWEEAVAACCKELSQHLPVDSEESHEKPSL